MFRVIGMIGCWILSFQNNDEPSSKVSRKHAVERINLFKSVFQDREDGYVGLPVHVSRPSVCDVSS